MVIKLLTVDLHFPGCSSLKEKRFVLSGLKARVGRNWNVAVADVGYQDKWQRSLLAIVAVGNDGSAAEAACAKVMSNLEKNRRIVILDCRQELR